MLAIVDDFLSELRAPSGGDDSNEHAFRADMEVAIEQAFFCLFGYPQKKSRARHLNDHNAAAVGLVFYVQSNNKRT